MDQYFGVIYRHIRDHKVVLAVGGLTILFFVLMALTPGRGAQIEVRLQSSKPGLAQLFYDTGSGYNERQSSVQYVKDGQNKVMFNLPDGRYFKLRLDPINRKKTSVTINGLGVASGDKINQKLALSHVVALANVDIIKKTGRLLHLRTSATNGDAQLQIILNSPLVVAPASSHVLLKLLVAFAFALFLIYTVRNVRQWQLGLSQVVTVGMLVVLVLIVVMDMISIKTWNVHPDESLHLSCFEFFLHHFWPARVGDPAQVASLTTSPFGTSYLNRLDVIYFISAHTMQALAFLFHKPLVMARAFQHFLWVALLVFALRQKSWRASLVVVLLSPQIWYVFSYYNGDAFPLFLGLVAAALVTDPQGSIHRYLDGDKRKVWWGVLAFALVTGLLVVSKANSLPVVLCVFLWIAVQHLALRWRELMGVILAAILFGIGIFAAKLSHMEMNLMDPRILMGLGVVAGIVAATSFIWRYWRDKDLRPRVHRVLVVLGLVIIVAAPRVGDDLYLNGAPSAKAAAVARARETYAARQFKPSILEQGKGYSTLEIARKGVGLSEMLFSPMHWFSISARSAFGTYGYMSIWGGWVYYRLIWLVTAIFSAGVFLGLIGAFRKQGFKLAATVLSCAILVVLSSILFSWVVGFQPQGRYLLPVVSLLALAAGGSRKYVEGPIGRALLICGFVLSVYSFVFVGLAGIARLT